MANLAPSALLTGATGFVGSRLARHLVDRGWRVTALVRSSSNVEPLAPAGGKVGTIAFDPDTLPASLRELRPDVVIHLASLYIAQHNASDIPALIASNLTFGTHVLEATSDAGITRFVNAGTAWQHYQGADYRPVNLYAATKQAFEDLIAYYCDARGMRSITLKLFDTYGPVDPRPKLINALLRAAETRQPLDLSPGEQLLDLVYIDDICSAFETAALRTATLPPGSHERYALSSGHRLSLKDLVAAMSAALNREIPVRFGAKPYRPREVMVPWSGSALPGWTPHVPLSEGLRRCFAATT